MRHFFLCVVVVLSGVGQSNADVVTALDIVLEEPHFNLPGSTITHGWAFRTNEVVTVTHLGWFDGIGRGNSGEHGSMGDGLASSHPLAIWTMEGTEVVGSIIQTTDLLEDQFRYVEIPPTILDGDTNYIVAGLSLTGSMVKDAMAGSSAAVPLDFNVDPAISFEGGRVKSTQSRLEFPGNRDTVLWLGPNFKFVTDPKPISDLTGNGFVDFEDLTVLLANWNVADATLSQGNLIFPDRSSVDFVDLTFLLSEWTGPGPAGSPKAALGGEAVPEPSSLLLGVMATLGLSFYRRRRRRAF